MRVQKILGVIIAIVYIHVILITQAQALVVLAPIALLTLIKGIVIVLSAIAFPITFLISKLKKRHHKKH
ncbi:MAG: hypothetical protein R3B92_02025 [Patescibacteria group bacterium]|uniref:Uncharacterized protein n=1 Tax=candidate division WWE3 bacterium TaxID=2053526 RepID=A0A955J297_UNCKA|nr:hypothetical protein [candidate division WWE3 bacterium]